MATGREDIPGTPAEGGVFELAAEAALVGIFCIVGNKCIYVNPRLREITGLEGNLSTPEAWAKAIHPDDGARVFAAWRTFVETGRPLAEEYRYCRNDGTIVWVQSEARRAQGLFDGAPAFVGTLTDITARKRIELELARSRHHLEATLAAIPDLLFEVTRDGTLISFHSRRVDLLTMPVEEFIGRQVVEVLPPDAAAIIMSALREAEVNGYSTGSQIALQPRLEWHWFELSIARKSGTPGEPPHFIVLSRDITARKGEQEALARASTEKDVLLAELHHRVKNTLQLVVSLLNLQIRAATDGSRAALSESRDRVMTIASAYTGLLDGLPDIDTNLVKYLTEVAQQLRTNYTIAGREVALFVTTNDAQLSIDRDRAVTCGLILTELVSNAFKHAFVGRAEGKISVEISRELDMVCIRVADNGIGSPKGRDQPARGRGLGTQIVTALAGQVSASVTNQPGESTCITVAFPLRRGRAR